MGWEFKNIFKKRSPEPTETEKKRERERKSQQAAMSRILDHPSDQPAEIFGELENVYNVKTPEGKMEIDYLNMVGDMMEMVGTRMEGLGFDEKENFIVKKIFNQGSGDFAITVTSNEGLSISYQQFKGRNSITIGREDSEKSIKLGAGFLNHGEFDLPGVFQNRDQVPELSTMFTQALALMNKAVRAQQEERATFEPKPDPGSPGGETPSPPAKEEEVRQWKNLNELMNDFPISSSTFAEGLKRLYGEQKQGDNYDKHKAMLSDLMDYVDRELDKLEGVELEEDSDLVIVNQQIVNRMKISQVDKEGKPLFSLEYKSNDDLSDTDNQMIITDNEREDTIFMTKEKLTKKGFDPSETAKWSRDDEFITIYLGLRTLKRLTDPNFEERFQAQRRT
jgi:hypothetical protein